MVTPDTRNDRADKDGARALWRAVLVVGLYHLFAATIVVLVLGLSMAVLVIGLVLHGGFLAAFCGGALIRLFSPLVISIARRPPRTSKVRIDLGRAEAERLYAMVDATAQALGVQSRAGVRVEASDRLSAALRPWPSREYDLCIGYELLAVLSADELHAVIAHEIAWLKAGHCRPLDWAAVGIERMTGFVSFLSSESGRGRGARRRGLHRAERSMLGPAVRALRESACESVSRCVRARTSLADAAAVGLCGVAATRSALSKHHSLRVKGRDLPQRDFLLHARQGDLNEWLRVSLSPSSDEDLKRLLTVHLAPEHVEGGFSFYPHIFDRLASIGGFGDLAPDGSPAIDLLPSPDLLGCTLMAKAEQSDAESQRRISGKLSKSAGNSLAQRRSRALSWAAMGMALVGFTMMICILLFHRQGGDPDAWTVVSISGIAGAAGLAAWWFLRRPRKLDELPVPGLEAWLSAMQSEERGAGLGDWQPEVKSRLDASIPQGARGKRALAAHWTEVCREAMAQCDYRRAWIASGRCLAVSPSSKVGLLCRGLSGAYLGQRSDYAKPIDKATATYGSDPSTSLALGLTGMCFNNWSYAEPFLLKAVDLRPDDPDLRAILGFCQENMDRLHVAIASLQAARDLDPASACIRKQFGRLLIKAGSPEQAIDELGMAEAEASSDLELLLMLVHANALSGRADEADRYAAIAVSISPGPSACLPLGNVYQDAGLPEKARSYYEAACLDGFLPQALVGLARIESNQGEIDAARAHLAGALDLTREPGPGASHPLSLLGQIFNALLSMEVPVEGCRGWATALNLSGTGLVGEKLHLLIYACDKATACGYAQWVQDALFPDRTILLAPIDMIEVKEEYQPSGSVIPGIHDFRIDQRQDDGTPGSAPGMASGA